MISLRDPVLALDFDLAAAAKLLDFERMAAGALAEEELAARRTDYLYW